MESSCLKIFILSGESKRKQEEVRESKVTERERKIRKAGGIRHVQCGKRICDFEFEFAVARRVHLIQDVWNPVHDQVTSRESFL